MTGLGVCVVLGAGVGAIRYRMTRSQSQQRVTESMQGIAQVAMREEEA